MKFAFAPRSYGIPRGCAPFWLDLQQWTFDPRVGATTFPKVDRMSNNRTSGSSRRALARPTGAELGGGGEASRKEDEEDG